MTERGEGDPGFWRRGMSRRGVVITVAVCLVIVVGAIGFAVVSGIPLF